MMNVELVCIVCPLGCRMTVSKVSDSGELSVTGNSCARGKVYALAEATAPKRTLPTTVRLRGSFLSRLPVKTAAPVPKELLFRCMEDIRRIEAVAPVSMGDVIAENVGGTGVDLIASRSMASAN